MKWNGLPRRAARRSVRGDGAWLALVVTVACSSNGPPGASDGPGTGVPDEPLEPGSPVALHLQAELLAPIQSEVEAANALDAAALSAAHALTFEDQLPSDPRDALGLEAIQGSALALDDADLASFAQHGFVILRRKQYPSFPYGYFDIYGSDLPVYVSADMVLEAVHHSYDDMLKTLEYAALIPRLTRLLDGMHGRLASAAASLDAETARDTDLYLGAARSLLTGSVQAPVTDLDREQLANFVARADRGSGSAEMRLFGSVREIDFSQFTPRGHYTESEELSRYFRAMMWLGRIDLRLIETLSSGSQVFRRRQLQAALALDRLLDDAGRHDWEVIDRTIGAFVGEHDEMTLPQLGALLADLGTTREAGLGTLSDQAVAQAIIDGEYGEQRILSQIVRKASDAPATLPLSSSFAFFGQRYTVDSHVFSNVVFDHVQTRVLPDPLDAAFAGFGNDFALSLLSGELAEHPYAGALASMRVLVDAHPSSYWQGSLYTSWLSALRALSPRAGAARDGTAGALDAPGLPAVARTEGWARRLTNTQLGSWAQLRHDTVLYAKQSYTVGTSCEFPDAYVEPYPEFFHAIARMGELGRNVVAELEFEGDNAALGERIDAYFSKLSSVAATLAEMAELQRSGMPHSAEHVSFINQAIRVEDVGSGDPWQTGWYKDLFFDPTSGITFDPTIADVHTDPGGPYPVSRDASVLHVGTGMPRPMVVSIDTCEGPRAYAGIVYAYHEHLEPSLRRLTDEEWQSKLNGLSGPLPSDVPWLEPVLGAP